MRPIPTGASTPLGAFVRYPGCRVLLSCAACAWSKSYKPEPMIDRLRKLRAGGHETTLADAARRVAWNCPRCQRMRWRFEFALPEGLDEREMRRLANLYRN